ncbi:MAG TPA: hypothetical protein VEP47_10645 [Reyranella sp.]|jgi:hypothetical protein|nr:hypothetical protein [Reyranella sp.]
MAEVLLRTGKQATRWIGEFTEDMQEYVEICALAVPYMYAKSVRNNAARIAASGTASGIG